LRTESRPTLPRAPRAKREAALRPLFVGIDARMTIQPRFAIRLPPGRPITICLGSRAAEAAVDAAEAVKGSGPPPAAARASPFVSDSTAKGSAPLPDPESRLAPFAEGVAGGAVGAAAAEPLSERWSSRGTWYASSATSTTASRSATIFWRRAFAAIRAVFADLRRLVAVAAATYGAVVVAVVVEPGAGAGAGADPFMNALSASVAVIRPPLSLLANETLSMA
jgi:hypothetical protein